MTLRWGLAAATAVLWASCSGPVVIPTPNLTEADTPAPEVLGDLAPLPLGGAGGAAAEDSPGPNQLTGVASIDHAGELSVDILDARGTGRIGGMPIATGRTLAVPQGKWMLTDAGSEYEITLRSTALPDAIVRLSGQSAFLVEPPINGPIPTLRIFGGQASLYLKHLPGTMTVETPVGPLVTRGGVFTVTVSPDFQVLVTCREGSVFLTGSQNAEALPGQVLVADRLGRGRTYAMTPNEAMVFSTRWLTVTTEDAAPVVQATLPRRLAAWSAVDTKVSTDEARFLALWFREAKIVLGSKVPGPDTWQIALAGDVRPSVWTSRPDAPGLLGELP